LSYTGGNLLIDSGSIDLGGKFYVNTEGYLLAESGSIAG